MHQNNGNSGQRGIARRPLYVLIFPIAFGLVSCGAIPTPNAPQPTAPQTTSPLSPDNQIELYGTRRCPFCRHFMAELESHGVPFVFHNVNEELANDELWQLLEQRAPDVHSVDLPVVLVNGALLQRPAYQEFKKYLLFL